MLIYVNLPEGNISVALWLFNIAMEAMAHLQMIFPLKPPFIMDFPVSYVKWPDGILRQHAEVMLKPPHSSFFLFLTQLPGVMSNPKLKEIGAMYGFGHGFASTCYYEILWANTGLDCIVFAAYFEFGWLPFWRHEVTQACWWTWEKIPNLQRVKMIKPQNGSSLQCQHSHGSRWEIPFFCDWGLVRWKKHPYRGFLKYGYPQIIHL